MNWLELDKESSREKFESYCASKEFVFDPSYNALRADLNMLFADALNSIGIDVSQIAQKNYSYQIDLNFGLTMYDTLNNRYGMNIRTASTEGVWRYLSVCVVPDLIDKRYGMDHPDRFWKKAKRLWLRVIWWYIHLSWQGDIESTFHILKNNSTDDILQLVDRCGRGGYRVDLYRALMKKNAELNLTEQRNKQLFRKIMVLNTARVQVIEPALADGGEQGYVDNLYNYFSI